MSLAQFGFGIAVFSVPDYFTKLKRLWKNPVALAWIGLYVLFLLGGFGSADTDYFLKDIRTKMPLWVMPAALALMPALTRRQHALVLHFFVAGCTVAMLAGWYNLFTDRVVDRRDLSPLVSHIRLAVYLLLSLFILLRFWLRENGELRFFPRWVYAVFFVVLAFWLFFLKSFTGVLFFVLLFPPAAAYLLLVKVKRNRRLAVWGILAALALGGAGYAGYCVHQYYRVNEVDFATLPKYTALGNPYRHDTGDTRRENGNYIWIYLQFEEINEAWPKRSSLPFNGPDKKNNPLLITFLRYMASKNLPRDAEGISRLEDRDIRNIENGIANYLYAEPFNIKGRIYETLWELEAYSGSGDPNGKSLSVRIELWKAAYSALLKSPWSGYGTGDVRHAMSDELKVLNSKLDYRRQFGPHNQYLAIALAIGIGGLIWFLLASFLPLWVLKTRPSFLFYVMLALLLLSALNEDIFETQASVTFFAFAYHFMLNGSSSQTGSSKEAGHKEAG